MTNEQKTRYDNSAASDWSFNTRAIHAGQSVDAEAGARNQPIYMTTSYVFNDTQHAQDRFALADPGPIYSRITNPTQEALENRIASLEGGVAAVAFASGMAAETAAITNLASAGDHIVTSPRLYGGTETLFEVTLPRLGIEVSFVDNTMATAAIARPLEHGADIVVVSTTKFYTGNGAALGGAIIDGGSFDWTVTRDGEPLFPYFVNPDPAYHGLVYADLGAPAYALKARAGILRDTGAAISPFNAWVALQGMDTLGLRVDKHNANALKVAEYLAGKDEVAHVNFAGLPDSPHYATKEKLGLKYTGSVLSFDLEGDANDKTRAWRFIDALKLHSNLANIGDVRSLVVHPATTTHSQSNEAGLTRAGITQATIRLSVGIEDIDDILADLDRGFEAIA